MRKLIIGSILVMLVCSTTVFVYAATPVPMPVPRVMGGQQASSGTPPVPLPSSLARTPTNTPMPTAVPDRFVATCVAKPAQGAPEPQMCIDGVTWAVYGATIYHMVDPDKVDWGISHGKAIGLNTLQLYGMQCSDNVPTDMLSPCLFRRIDYTIQQAKANAMHVLLDFSDYGILLRHTGHVPEAADQFAGWDNLLTTYANHVNIFTGAAYKNDPTIAFVQIYGEADAPNGSESYRPTTGQLTAFYRHTLATWHALAPHILGGSGALQYLDWNGGIDYKAIFADANNAICNSEINNSSERATTGPIVRDYCASIGKPWINGSVNVGGLARNDDATRAAFVSMEGAYNVTTYKSDGWMYWNLGDDDITVIPGTYDVGGPSVPKTNAAVLRWSCAAKSLPNMCGG